MSADPWSPPADKKQRLPARGSAAWEELKDALDEARAVHCHECSYRGPTLRKHFGFQWYHFMLMPLVIVAGGGIIGIIAIVAWAGTTRAACAGCGATDQIEPYEGDVSPDAEERWRLAAADHLRRHRTNQLIALGIVLSMLALAVLVFLL